MNSNEQKLTIETLLSSKDVFSRCIGIIKPEYFDPEYRPSVQFISEYFEKYHNIPSSKALNAKFPEMDYEYREHIPVSEEQSTCDDIELFCKQQAPKLQQTNATTANNIKYSQLIPFPPLFSFVHSQTDKRPRASS
jgi:hypothetical protein